MAGKLEELLDRVKAATGPDRELDGAIEVQARRFDAYRVGLNDRTRAYWKHNGATVYDGNTGYEAQRFTASIDATLALVERCLPSGTDLKLSLQVGGKYFHCEMETEEGDDITAFNHPSLPLAILAALLTALQHRAAGGGE